jgi:PEP-CTERM motif
MAPPFATPGWETYQMKFVKIAAVAAALGAAAALAAPAEAVTFAQFEVAPNSTIPNFLWTQDGAGTGGTLTAINQFGMPGAPVQFSFQTIPGMSNLPATLTFTGTVIDTPATNYGGQFLTQYGLNGSFEFSYAGTTPLTYNGKTYGAGADLLSGSFTSANISGQINASAGNVDDATSSGDVLGLTSDLLSFGSGDRSYSFSLTSIDPTLSAGSGLSLSSFEAVGTGNFEAALSLGGGAGGVPEPSTWAMIIVGLGALGATLRRRSNSLVPA